MSITKTNALYIEIPGYLNNQICLDSMIVLNEYKNMRILSTSYNTEKNKRSYILVEDKNDPIKYVGRLKDISLDALINYNFIVDEYYWCNINREYKLDFSNICFSAGFNVFDEIKKNKYFMLTYLPGISFSIKVIDPIKHQYVLLLENNNYSPIDRLKTFI